MMTLLVITQTVAAVLLGAVGLFPTLQRLGGGLNRTGYVLFGAGVTAFFVSTVSIQRLTAAEGDRAREQLGAAQHRIEKLAERYFSATVEQIMTKRGGPAIPPGPSARNVIQIETPADGSKVEQRHLVEGTVSDLTKAVWVVVHPMDTSSYWVQPQVSVRSGGAWSVSPYFGRSGDLDSGKRFEVLAIADPADELREGDNFDTWPKAKWVSEAVTLIRR